MTEPHIDPTDAAARALFTRGIEGPIVMLNLLRFRETADYGAAPDLAPPEPVTGAEAYATYERLTTPMLRASGGEVLFAGTGSAWFIGPEGERWDRMLLIRQASLQSFLSFASDPAYLAILGHRTAALADSRLLPVVED